MILQAALLKTRSLFLLLVCAAVLCSCGKKPTELEKPDIVLSTYPQKYPKTELVPGNGPQFEDTDAQAGTYTSDNSFSE